MIKQIGISDMAHLSADERLIVTNLNGLKVREIDLAVMNEELIGLVIRIYQYKSFNPPIQKDLILQVQVLKDDCDNYFKTLTLKEIEYAIKKGASGAYGEDCFLSNANFSKWISRYMVSQERKSAIVEKNRISQMGGEIMLTDDEKFKKMVEYSLTLFSEFKAKKEVVDLGNAVYDFLDKQKLIPFTAERKREFLAQARVKMVDNIDKEMAKAKSQFNRGEITKLEYKLSDVLKKDNLIIPTAKRIALNTFFAELVETETDLKDLFMD